MLILCLTSVTELISDNVSETGNVISSSGSIMDACISKMAEEDASALEELYRIASGGIYGYALSILKNRHDAEDVLHDCFLAAWSSAASYKSKGKPMAWLITITRNLCLQKLRNYKRKAELPDEDWDSLLAEDGMTAEDRIIIAECMNILSDDERQIVTLHAVAGFKHREIAETMGVPLATVLSKYNRALKKLKKALLKGE